MSVKLALGWDKHVRQAWACAVFFSSSSSASILKYFSKQKLCANLGIFTVWYYSLFTLIDVDDHLACLESRFSDADQWTNSNTRWNCKAMKSLYHPWTHCSYVSCFFDSIPSRSSQIPCQGSQCSPNPVKPFYELFF